MRENRSSRREFLRQAASLAGGVWLGGKQGQDAAPASDADATLTLRTASKHQVIENFGASDAWSMDPIGREWTVENREKIADLLFSREKGIGLSCWRFNVGAGGAVTDKATLWDPWRGAECFRQTEAEGYDWSKQAGQQWFLKAARRRGVDQFVACVYSPPVWMTRNGHAHGDKTVGSTNLKPGYEGEFAKFL